MPTPLSAAAGRPLALTLVLALGLMLAGAMACEREAHIARAPAREIPEAELPELYAALESHDGEAVQRATERILEAGDRRFAAVLIEGLRIAHLASGESAGHNDRVVALERLTGQRFGGDWFRWLEWYAETELEPPPGFLGYRSRLLARIDPALGAFLAEGAPARIRPEWVRWGGVLPGAIPALTNPKLTAADRAEGLVDAEPVFGVVHRGEARAYPIRVLDWHEIVNDHVGGEAIAVASCALCGSATAYRAQTPDGASHAFETSGLLDRGNKLMFDTRTRTLWSQLGGRAVLGPLAAEELTLAAVPGVVTSWGEWRARHPETTVLSLDTGHERAYEPGQPYGAYLASAKLLFPVIHHDARLAAKARVYGVALAGGAKAWPLEGLLERDVVNDEVGGEPLVLVARGEAVPIEGDVPGVGRIRYLSGAAVRAYRRVDGRLSAGDSADELRDATGGRWRVEEDALHGPDGALAPRVPGTLAYWFAWRSFHPETEVFGMSEIQPTEVSK